MRDTILLVCAILGAIASLIAIITFVERRKKKKGLSPDDKNPPNVKIKGSHVVNDNIILSENSLSIPYKTLFGSPESNINELRVGDISIKKKDDYFSIENDFLNHFGPEKVREIKSTYGNEPKCRIESYKEKIQPGNIPNIYTFEMSKIWYYDYLLTNCILDENIDKSNKTTFRDKYYSFNNRHDFSNSKISNICGVGLFIITRDDKIIITKNSDNVSVYPNEFSYSSSGTMNWENDEINPFYDIQRETLEEIYYNPNIEDLFLFALGIDSKKQYFQFSFYEKSPKLSSEILESAPNARDFDAEIDNIIAIPFNLESIYELLTQNPWEPAAAYSLILLLKKKYGNNKVNTLFNKDQSTELIKEQLEFIWNERANRKGLLPVMSNRYPFSELNSKSQQYVDEVLGFIGKDILNKNICEVGGGIGRFTAPFARSSQSVTVIDLCEKMIEKNKKHIGDLISKVKYVKTSIDDYKPRKKFDVVIISLVLIHITNKAMFDKTIDIIKSMADVVYIFEHVDIKYSIDLQTRLKSSNELVKAFEPYKIKKKKYHNLFEDRIFFAKFVKC